MSGTPKRPEIRHVVVLMLENRSFDCMLGQLYPASAAFDGLTGTETNLWHKPDGTAEPIAVWTDPTDAPGAMTAPDPDPGESFDDIHAQIAGTRPDAPAMSGFVDNYVSLGTAPGRDPAAVMHYFTPAHVPVISTLARSFGVSDRWFASAPCQTWPNRFFAHTGTADGHVNNTPDCVPYTMPTVFNRLLAENWSWRIFFHDFPQTATLGALWLHPLHFRLFDDFLADAASGNLPDYSFIEPRYFADILGNAMPNDEHPPHDVTYGEQLIAQVYNALRAGPAWKNTLLIVTYDEHGGCYDHVPPGPAVSPGGEAPDGFTFDRYGVRVPAVIVSPYVGAGSVIRPEGDTPFDHCSIFKTLQELFDLDPRPLTPRTAAAPSLLPAFGASPDNDGPERIVPPARTPSPAEVARIAALPPNHLQQGFSHAAMRLPRAGADLAAHAAHLATIGPQAPHASVDDALDAVRSGVGSFLGR